MDKDTGNRQEEGQDDISILESIEEEPIEEPIDPLADLALELTMCLMSLESHQDGAGFCDWCTCQLRFHVPTGNGCELCGCYSDTAHTSPKLELTYMPASKSKLPRQQVRTLEVDTQDRAKIAREVLRELSE